VKKALAAVIGAVLLFAIGVAVGESLHDNPKPGGRQTIVRTLTPLPLAPETRLIHSAPLVAVQAQPIAADTESGMPVTYSASMPPISASGMFRMMSAAPLNDLNASKSRMKMRRMEIGTMTESRAIARSWFSNSPDQLIV